MHSNMRIPKPQHNCYYLIKQWATLAVKFLKKKNNKNLRNNIIKWLDQPGKVLNSDKLATLCKGNDYLSVMLYME